MSAEKRRHAGPAAHDTPSQRPRAVRAAHRRRARLRARPGGTRRAGEHLARPARPSRRPQPGAVPRAGHRRSRREGHRRVLPARRPGRRARRHARGDRGRRRGGPARPRASSPAGGCAVAGLPAGLDPAAWPLARLRPGGPDLLLAPGDPDAGQAALAITGCHGPGCCSPREPGGADGPALLYAACQRVLAPGGVLAVITASRAPGGQLADLAGHAVAAARAAGLVYAQHIVLVHAAIDGDHLAPDPAATAPVSRAGGTSIHSDLLVFTKPGGAPQHA